VDRRRQKALVSAFIAAWTLVFHYESLRYSFLDPLVGRELPKVKFLFPPAGWIMFYKVDKADGFAEVYGRKGEAVELIDPHRIFETRWLGYDDIRRNVLVTALEPAYARDFCGFLERKFPGYDGFDVVEAWIPDVTEKAPRILRQVAYKC
jgi:hypothetical protein